MPRSPEVVYPPPVGVPLPPPPAPASDDGLRRVTPQEVLLGVGAVALVVAGAASLSRAGWVLTTVLALGTLAASLRCGARGLRTSAEVLAVATVALLVVGARADSGATSAAVLAGLAGFCWLLSRVARRTVTWPIAAWLSAQLAVLVELGAAGPTGLPHVTAVLGTGLAGLLLALRARRSVAPVVLVSASPWWLVGVVEGVHLVWTTSPGAAAPATVLLVAAAAALLAVRRRPVLRRLLGPRPLAPVLAGLVAGAALAGQLQAAGALGAPAAGYLGLLTAVVVAERASPGPRSSVRPAGLALACTATALAVVQLAVDGRLTALALLLLAAAAPAALVAARQPADRPGALPVAVGCLAGSALLAEADGTLGAGGAGPLLLGLAVAALAAASLERHHRDELPLAGSGAVVGLVAVAEIGRHGGVPSLAGALAVLGAALVGYASRTDRGPARAGGCLALLAACWLMVADADVRVAEAYSLPLAAVLLLYSGRRLVTAPSGSAWGPALAAGYLPSVFLALVQPAPQRILLVVLAATLTTVAATRWGVRAPFLAGAAVLVVLGVGRLVVVLPAPGLVAFLGAGAVLLAVGAGYERRRHQAREAIASLADMR